MDMDTDFGGHEVIKDMDEDMDVDQNIEDGCRERGDKRR